MLGLTFLYQTLEEVEKMLKVDVAIIGGGPAGMAAALGSAQNGSSTLLIERNETLGGILNQCIHNGFGLHYFGTEYTGPEFAYELEKKIKKEKNITVLTQTFVTKIEPYKLTIMNTNGEQTITAKAIILATGARERTPANICLTGDRPEGILTAGVAQKMVNIYGKLPGEEVVILGSGDIGLIMARRLTFEGAKVKAVLEINSSSSGLKRNVLQCLDDYNIPLLYNTTVFNVVGKNRVEGIYYGQVDSSFNQIKETEKFLKCDCLILSVGLTPETDLLPQLNLMRPTNGAIVNEYYQTNIESVFTCLEIIQLNACNANAVSLNRICLSVDYDINCLSFEGFTIIVKDLNLIILIGAIIHFNVNIPAQAWFNEDIVNYTFIIQWIQYCQFMTSRIQINI